MSEEFETFCRNNNILITLANLPVKVRGFCFYDGNDYNICICNKHSYKQNLVTLTHEMIHIFENHFTCDIKYFEFCEKQTDIIVEQLKLFQHSCLESTFS